MKNILITIPFILLTSCAGLLTNEQEQRYRNIEERLEKLEEKVASIEESIYKTNVRIDNLSKNITDVRIEVEKLKISSLNTEDIPENKVSERRIVRSNLNYRDMYNKAFRLYTLKKLHQAIEAFDKFIQNFPDNDLTDNAYFWKGRSYFELGNLERAEDIFKDLISKCEEGTLPDCNKAPSAYLMLGRIYEMQGKYDEADAVYESLKEKYPTSEEAQSLM